MTQPDNQADRRIDALLREVGPHVPQPALAEDARARLLATIDHADAQTAMGRAGRSRGRMKWAALTAASLAAVLALACVLLWLDRQRTEDQLASAQWQTGEALQLLMNARRTQPSIPVPEHLDGLSGADLVLITFHHDLCPLARLCTPRFKELESRHRGGPARFMTFDVTGSKRDSVEQEIDALGMSFALLGPPGAETGVVKVLDTVHRRVLCSAPGERGLEQAERLLAMVSSGERR